MSAVKRLRIEHDTTYLYRQVVTFGRHRLVLRPREGHDVRVESWQLDITPAHQLVWTRDVYNNSIAIVDFIESAAQLQVRSTVTIERSVPFPRQESSDPWRIPLPVAYEAMELPIIQAYQSPSFPEDVEELRKWLQRFPEVAGSVDVESQAMHLCAIIHREIQYQRRMAKGVQTPGQTLHLGYGSCRDLATLMMDAARSLGLAARFVSGYLDCPASEAGRAAMHAWTEVYLPILGWRGFDPTLCEPASLKHITVGVSQHPRGVMPISGQFTGSTAAFVEMTAQVKIERLGGTGSPIVDAE